MTENESLKIMLAYKLGRGCKPHYSDEEIEKAFDTAISALQEIQQYRAIGTVEECKELASMFTQEKKNALSKIVDEWNEYIEIGTVEECREAVEKQKPKKPHRNYEKFSGLWCRCGWYLGKKQCLDIKYCPNCGQAIDENLEEMEDE